MLLDATEDVYLEMNVDLWTPEYRNKSLYVWKFLIDAIKKVKLKHFGMTLTQSISVTKLSNKTTVISTQPN